MKDMRFQNLPFKIESACVRAWYRATGQRPSSAPFVSGDSFRSLAHHILEEGNEIDPARVRKGDIVFVEAVKLSVFAESILPGVKQQFVLITHNGDLNIDGSFLFLAEDRRMLHWFAQNSLIKHPKVTAIPIGLENRLHHYNGVIRDFERLSRRKSQKTNRILYGFTVGTNEKERLPALEALRASALSDPVDRTNSRDYRERLERYAFVASPPGNGVDCHRTWEALYLKVIPIVKRSMFYESFPCLPVLALADWAEIGALESLFLSQSYQQLSAQIETTPYLRFSYWADLVHRARAIEPC